MPRALQIFRVFLPGAVAQILVGLLVWLVSISVLQPGMAPVLLLFGPLVLFPLLLEMEGHRPAIRWLAFGAFLPAIASYEFDPGIDAGALQSPWLDIPFMLRWHAPIQVFGFALPGVVAWSQVTQDNQILS